MLVARGPADNRAQAPGRLRQPFECPMSDDVRVEVRRSGRRFEAAAVLDLAADAQTVWDTITDYGALAQFMPGILACRVIERHPPVRGTERLVIEQQGKFRYLMFSQTMTVLMHVEHRWPQVAEAKAAHIDLGMFKRRAIDVFEGRYELQPLAARRGLPRTQLRYTALIGLRLPPPPAVGSVAVRQNLAAQLDAVAREVARRSGRTAADAARRR